MKKFTENIINVFAPIMIAALTKSLTTLTFSHALTFLMNSQDEVARVAPFTTYAFQQIVTILFIKQEILSQMLGYYDTYAQNATHELWASNLTK